PQIKDGKIDVDVTAETADLDESKDYDVLTWVAHGLPTGDAELYRAPIELTADQKEALFPGEDDSEAEGDADGSEGSDDGAADAAEGEADDNGAADGAEGEADDNGAADAAEGDTDGAEADDNGAADGAEGDTDGAEADGKGEIGRAHV